MNLLNSSDGSRKAQQEMYGTWFSKDGSAKYYTDKCAALIKKYTTWLQNTEELLTAKKTEMLKAREEEIRQFLSSFTPEELAAFQNGNSN